MPSRFMISAIAVPSFMAVSSPWNGPILERPSRRVFGTGFARPVKQAAPVAAVVLICAVRRCLRRLEARYGVQGGGKTGPFAETDLTDFSACSSMGGQPFQP